MSKHKKTAPVQPEPHGHHHGHDELAAVKVFIETYTRPILIAVIVVAVGVVGGHVWRNRQVDRRIHAARALAEARSVPEFEDIVRDFAGTPTAPLALLSLGRLQYDQGDFTAARNTYQRFLDSYARHELAPAARLGRVHAIEASDAPGALTEAAAGYERFVAAHADHFLTPQAVFGLARVRAAQGDTDAARDLYQQFLAEHPESPWAQHAESRIDLLDRGLAVPAPLPVAPVTDEPLAIPAPPSADDIDAVPFIPAPVQEAPPVEHETPVDAPVATPDTESPAVEIEDGSDTE